MIFIPFNTPSLKNSKVKTSRGVFSSATVTKYLRLLGIQHYSVSKKTVKGYVNRPNKFEELRGQFEFEMEGLSPPYDIGLHFVRKDKRSFDFGNISQIIFDLMTSHDIIPDDNMNFVLPYPLKIEGKAYSVDKENPGVYVQINNLKTVSNIEKTEELNCLIVDNNGEDTE